MNLVEFYRLAEQVSAGDVIPLMVFPIGKWKSGIQGYETLDLTAELAEKLIANFDAGVLGTEPALDSSGRHDASTQAAGWYKRLYVAPMKKGGEALFGDVEVTDLGAELLNSKRYRYHSLELGPHTDNATGAKVWPVFRGGTLTNVPVLRMMPEVLATPEVMAASEYLEFALSELSPADPDPVVELLTEMEGLAGKLDEALKGKKGMPTVRTFLREIRAKIGAHKLAEPGSYQDLREAIERALTDLLSGRQWVVDFGDSWVVYENGALEDAPRLWRVPYVREGSEITFGTPAEVERQTNYIPKSPSPPEPSGDTTAEPVGDSASGTGVGLSTPSIRKETKRMSELTQLLKLAEDADDAVILAEVRKVAAERDTAVTKLAESEHKTAVGAVTIALDEAIKEGRIAPSERDGYLELAEADAERATKMIASRQSKVIDLSEHGSGGVSSEPATHKNASVELAGKVAARAKADNVSFSEAKRLVLSEDHDLAERYEAFRRGEKED